MPYKLSFWIVMALVSLNAGHVALNASGTYDYIGVSPNLCDTGPLEDSQEQAKAFGTGQGAGETLFNLYNVLANVLDSIFDSILPAAKMIKCAGVPNYLVNFAFATLAMIPGFDLIVFLRSG